MNPLEIKGARTRLGFTQQEVADKLDMSLPSYRKKEHGEVKFTDPQKAALSELFGFSYEQMNEYLYDNLLPERF